MIVYLRLQSNESLQHFGRQVSSAVNLFSLIKLLIKKVRLKRLAMLVCGLTDRLLRPRSVKLQTIVKLQFAFISDQFVIAGELLILMNVNGRDRNILFHLVAMQSSAEHFPHDI